jgi:hypothetical protein
VVFFLWECGETELKHSKKSARLSSIGHSVHCTTHSCETPIAHAYVKFSRAPSSETKQPIHTSKEKQRPHLSNLGACQDRGGTAEFQREI